MLRYAVGLMITVIIIFGWQNVVRELAKRGRIWVLVPEMTALAIMRDRAVDFILVICSDKVWEELKICCGIVDSEEERKIKDPENKLNLQLSRQPQSALARLFGFRPSQIGGNKIIRLRKGLYFIGMPWIYRVYEWFLTETDKLSAKKALHSLTLAILNIVYEPEEIDPKNGVINLLTADGVEVKARLTFYGTVRNPEKALFNIEHIKTFIRDLIIPAWRNVLSEFQFFQYMEKADSAEKYLIAAMEILNNKLRKDLGIHETKKAREDKEKFRDLIGSFTGVAKRLYDEGGIIAEDLTLSEFQPATGEVAKALENILIAKTEAEAAVQRADGQKQVDKLDGEGKHEKLVALGDDKHFVLTIEAIEKVSENLGKAQTLALLGRGVFGPLFDQLPAVLEKASLQ